MSVLAEIGVVLGSAAAGAVINAVSQSAATRRAERRADRQRAGDLFSQVVNAVTQLQTEKAVFRERRDSWRPNLQAIGQAFLELAAARAAGNWLRGAAAGVREFRAWDAAEGVRFVERVQAAAAQAGPALVALSLLSPQLQAAAGTISDALAAAVNARGPQELQEAGQHLNEAMAGLRTAVYAYTAPRRQWPRLPGRSRDRAISP